jgi:SAM-dependent methyltransferase
MEERMKPFDRKLLRLRRARAARGLPGYDFLLKEVGERLLERLEDIRRSFPLALDLGCHDGTLGRLARGRGGIRCLVQADLSEAMAAAASKEAGPALVLDEEALPFAPGSFDAVLSLLDLHWVNDLPGCLAQVKHCLKPDGLFLAALFGGETLWELRQCLMEAEMELEGGLSPRVSPQLELADAAGLLQRAGFALPVADRDRVTVDYPNALKLMEDLRGMGESNAVAQRRRSFTRRRTLLRAAELYQERFAGPDTRVSATFEIFFLTAWTPAASQPQALRPGSAKTRLAEALGTEERKTGVKARPQRAAKGKPQ